MSRPLRRSSLGRILTQVAAAYGVSVKDLKTSRRGRGSHNLARAAAMALARSAGGHACQQMRNSPRAWLNWRGN